MNSFKTKFRFNLKAIMDILSELPKACSHAIHR